MEPTKQQQETFEALQQIVLDNLLAELDDESNFIGEDEYH